MLGGAAGEKLRRGGGQDRLVQGAAGAGRHRPAVEGRRLPHHPRPAFVRYGLVDDPDGGPTRLRQRDQRAEDRPPGDRSEEHTSELQSLMRISYAVFCLKKKNYKQIQINYTQKGRDKTISKSSE